MEEQAKQELLHLSNHGYNEAIRMVLHRATEQFGVPNTNNEHRISEYIIAGYTRITIKIVTQRRNYIDISIPTV